MPPSNSRTTSRSWRAVNWVLAAIGVAFFAGVGTAIWQAVQNKAEELTDSGPVAVNVHPDPAFWKDKRPDWDPYFYYIPLNRSQLSPPPDDCRDRRAWAVQQGGSDADETRVALTLTGRRSAQVSLDAMEVDIVSREPVAGGVVAACPVGGASGGARGLDVDLKAETVSFVVEDEEVPARYDLKLWIGHSHEGATYLPR